MFKRNELVERALKDDQTAGLPLFEQGKKRSRRSKHIVERSPRSMRVATDTRNLAHTILTLDPDLLAKVERIVYDEFKKFPDATNQEIADSLGWQINRVTGRTFRLRELGYVRPSVKRQCKSTGNIVQAWRAL